jgi:tRNA(His) guanylyltransferase
VSKDLTISDRMKQYYEDVYRIFLPRRMPCIIRIDGKCFHTLTRGFDKPFDNDLADVMLYTAKELCTEIQGAKLAYWQSDEISILLTDYDTLQTDAWFGKNIQKMTSISASIATAAFNSRAKWHNDKNESLCLPIKFNQLGIFDSRVFVLPKEEVCNYFIDRSQDATRNSINSLGQANFSHKQLHGLNTGKVQDLLFKEKGVNWNDQPTIYKRGACVVKNVDGWMVDREIPIFSQDREYINKWVNIGEE